MTLRLCLGLIEKLQQKGLDGKEDTTKIRCQVLDFPLDATYYSHP